MGGDIRGAVKDIIMEYHQRAVSDLVNIKLPVIGTKLKTSLCSQHCVLRSMGPSATVSTYISGLWQMVEKHYSPLLVK